MRIITVSKMIEIERFHNIIEVFTVCRHRHKRNRFVQIVDDGNPVIGVFFPNADSFLKCFAPGIVKSVITFIVMPVKEINNAVAFEHVANYRILRLRIFL